MPKNPVKPDAKSADAEAQALLHDALRDEDGAVKRAEDREKWQETYQKFEMVKFVIIAGAVVVVGAGVGLYFWLGHRAEQRAAAEAKMQEESLARDAESEVAALVASHEYQQARDVLNNFRQRGLEGQVGQKLDADIEAAGLTRRQALTAKVKEDLARRDWRAAKSRLDEAERELQGIVNLGDLFTLREQAEAGPSRDAIDRSRTLFDKGDLEGAIAAAAEAVKLQTSGGAASDWERTLQEKIGGRLRVEGTPAGATVKLDGQRAGRLGETLSGFGWGGFKLEVAADGHWGWEGQVDLHYPDVVVRRVDLMPFVADPVWALHITRGRPAQQLVVAYYDRNRPQGDLTSALKALVQPDLAATAAAADRSLDAALKAADAEFAAALARQDGPAALDVLGAFLAAYPGAADRVWEAYGDRVSTLVRRLERGCAACLGRGTKPCQRCGGTGQVETFAPCSRCGRDGADPGKLICIQCKGTAKIKCRTCRGSGKVKKRGAEPGQDDKQDCDQCRGSGEAPCNNRSCVEGKVTCQTCKGTGSLPSTAACQECSAGGFRCDTCEGTGDRERVPLYEREQQERDLYAVIAERG